MGVAGQNKHGEGCGGVETAAGCGEVRYSKCGKGKVWREQCDGAKNGVGKTGWHCGAGWIAACTTALCLRFDSPTLGPCFPIPRPIALLFGHITLGRITSHWVVSQHVGSHHSASGCVTAHQVASQRIGSRHSASHCIGLCRIASGHVTSHQVGSVTLLSGWSCYYQAYLVCFPSLLLSRSFAHSSPPLPAKV